MCYDLILVVGKAVVQQDPRDYLQASRLCGCIMRPVGVLAIRPSAHTQGPCTLDADTQPILNADLDAALCRPCVTLLRRHNATCL